MLDLLYENLVSIVAALIGLVLAFAIVCYLFPTIARIVLKGFLYISILLFFGSLGSDFVSTGIRYFVGDRELERWTTSVGPGSIFSVIFPVFGVAVILAVSGFIIYLCRQMQSQTSGTILGLVVAVVFLAACYFWTSFLVYSPKSTYVVAAKVYVIILIYGLFGAGLMMFMYEKISGEKLS